MLLNMILIPNKTRRPLQSVERARLPFQSSNTLQYHPTDSRYPILCNTTILQTVKLRYCIQPSCRLPKDIYSNRGRVREGELDSVFLGRHSPPKPATGCHRPPQAARHPGPADPGILPKPMKTYKINEKPPSGTSSNFLQQLVTSWNHIEQLPGSICRPPGIIWQHL